MTPRYIIAKERANAPEGFRNLTEQEIANQFLKKEIEDYTSKWKEILHSWTGRLMLLNS